MKMEEHGTKETFLGNVAFSLLDRRYDTLYN